MAVRASIALLRWLRSSLRKKPQSLVGAGIVTGKNIVALRVKLGGGDGDCIVQEAVQSAKLIIRDRGIKLDWEIGHGLAEIAVVVDDLLNREPVLEQLPAMLLRSDPHRGQNRIYAAGGTR